MKLLVGTSGWAYDWNPGGLDWFVQNSRLNAVELNASFYRYPYPNQVKGWANKGKKLRWALKVNRLVTHIYKFNQTGWTRWKSFQKLFKSLDRMVDFYLFQLPPSMGPDSKKRVESFYKKTKLGERFALEWRKEEWFAKENVEWAKKLGLTLVSVDAPKFSREIYNTGGLVYVRMHGRSGWYSHNYSEQEIREVLGKIQATRPRKAYVFFNNDHAMLENAQRMMGMV